MSVEEMIASLENQKLACIQRYEDAIESLKDLQETPGPSEPTPKRVLSFEPLDIPGELLSRTILDSRGPY